MSSQGRASSAQTSGCRLEVSTCSRPSTPVHSSRSPRIHASGHPPPASPGHLHPSLAAVQLGADTHRRRTTSHSPSPPPPVSKKKKGFIRRWITKLLIANTFRPPRRISASALRARGRRHKPLVRRPWKTWKRRPTRRRYLGHVPERIVGALGAGVRHQTGDGVGERSGKDKSRGSVQEPGSVDAASRQGRGVQAPGPGASLSIKFSVYTTLGETSFDVMRLRAWEGAGVGRARWSRAAPSDRRSSRWGFTWKGGRARGFTLPQPPSGFRLSAAPR